MGLVEQMMGSSSEHVDMKKQLYAMLGEQCSQGDTNACQQLAQMMQQDEMMAMQDQQRQRQMREQEIMEMQQRNMPQQRLGG